MTNRLIVAFTLILAAALPARAQQLKMHLQDGRVTLEATAVPVRQILAEWARIGGTRIVGGDKVTGAPLTLKLVDMPERQALDIILRNVAGFMAAPRQAAATPGASTYDRILILATTSAPAQAAAPTGRGTSATITGPLANRRAPPRPPNLPPSPAENDADNEAERSDEDQADTGVSQQPVFTFPSPPGAVNGNQVFVPMPNGPAFARPGQPGSIAAPVITLQPNANGQPTVYTFVPNVDGPPTPAGTPPAGFGVIGSPTPGMIQQPPAAPAPGQPQRPPRQ